MGGSESAYKKDLMEKFEAFQRGSECVPASFFSRQLPPDVQGMTIDVGIDGHLLSYSGTNSNAALNQYSSQMKTEMVNNLPDYVEKVGSVMAGVSSVPNAVGIGAFCIAMILRICVSATKDSKTPNTDNLLRKVFAEEKAKEVHALMQEYMKRYSMHLTSDRVLIEETNRLETQLSVQLTRLKDSLLTKGQMNDPALKSWTNGAAFHAQMLIHLARLKKKTENTEFENAKTAARIAIGTYHSDLKTLLEKYTIYKEKDPLGVTHNLEYFIFCCMQKICCKATCYSYPPHMPTIVESLQYIFSGNDQIIKLKKYFPDLLMNLDILADQQENFTKPALK